MDGLERLTYAWGKADGEARAAFLRGILEAQGLKGESEITMVSQVNSRDGSPAVLFRWGEQVLIMESATAKRHGLAILETALGADADAFLFRWVREQIGGTPEHAAQVLMDFRHWRETTTREEAAS